MTDCSICCEKFNKRNHKKVNCSFCDFVSCRTCVQQYLLSNSNDPHCMNCKNAWNREFIDESCSKTFRMKELKNHRENILLEREKCMLPETQHLVAREKRIRKIRELIKEAEDELKRQKGHIANLYNEMDFVRNGGPLDGNGDEKEKKQFVRKCPIEDCKGFLSTRWKCDICDNHICSECNEKKEENHECDPSNVETVKLLKKDSKPCPKCGTIHFRISGCSQMWCPSCHTAYNWNTGRIETGIIHNPHYYEFQRNTGTNGRNLGDIPCGGFPTMYEMRRVFDPRDAQFNTIYGIHNLIAHIENYELRWNYNNIPERVNNQELRVKYLMNEINETEFKQTIQKREKALEKKRDTHNILTMVSNTGSDLLRQLIQEKHRLGEIQNIFENLRTYTNTTFMKISQRYGNQSMKITKDWKLDKLKNGKN